MMPAPHNSPDTVAALLQAQCALRGTDAAHLHALAGARRDAAFGKRVFVRAVLELSNFCRQTCDYCGIRRDNRELRRRSLPLEVLRRIVLEDLPASVTDINLQAGENPAVIETALALIREIRQHTRLGISIGFGTLPFRHYDALRDAGASFYVLKIETGAPDHFSALHAPGTADQRAAAVRYLASTGWFVSSGLIYGLPGQTAETLDATFRLLADLPLAGISVSPFIPGETTPLWDQPCADIEDTLNCVAAMRLAFPDRIIPAVSAMAILKKEAYVQALKAGANLVTINLTPDDWTEEYPIYSSSRTLIKETAALEFIERAGLEPSTQGITEFLNARNPPAPEAPHT